MKQVFVIGGGDAFATQEEFLNYLRTREIDLAWLTHKGWKDSLQATLGAEFKVVAPRMPNAQNAKYIEWETWFKRHVQFMQDGVILVGHSLGGLFLAKYLSEEKLPVRIAGVLLVAPPYNDDGGRPIVEFVLPQSLAGLEAQGGKLFVYFSKDDPIVSFGELAKYQAALPNATVRVFGDRGHFLDEQFPEIVEDIKAL